MFSNENFEVTSQLATMNMMGEESKKLCDQVQKLQIMVDELTEVVEDVEIKANFQIWLTTAVTKSTKLKSRKHNNYVPIRSTASLENQ